MGITWGFREDAFESTKALLCLGAVIGIEMLISGHLPTPTKSIDK